MKKIYIIGNIGSGKSLFSQILYDKLADSGFRVSLLDLDKIGHRVLQYEEVINLLNKEFGQFKSRSKLASIVFESEKSINKLDSIVRPYILMEMKKILEKNQNNGFDYTIVEESVYSGHRDEFSECADYLIAVVSDYFTRLNRCLSRGMTESDFKKRNDLQVNQDVLINNANFVVENNKEIDNLKHFIDDCIKKL